MSISPQKIKQKILELTRLFCIERNIFQRFVIVYRYIRLLNKDPLTKEILQKMFDDTAKVMGKLQKNGMDEEEFLDVKGEAIYTNDFWMYYSNLEVIHGKMKNIKECKTCDKVKFSNLSRLYSKPYSKEMLNLSFKVINSNVFDQLDQKCFLDEDKKVGKTYFDEKKSVLYIKDKKVLINRQGKITNSHKILKYIFIDNKKNLEDDFFYSEIAENEFNELDYKERKNNWRTYFRACQDINDKILNQTNELIKDFLEFNTGKKGKASINKKYL
jgi:hypothetical protein